MIQTVQFPLEHSLPVVSPTAQTTNGNKLSYNISTVIIFKFDVVRQHVITQQIVFHILQFIGVADKHVFGIFFSGNIICAVQLLNAPFFKRLIRTVNRFCRIFRSIHCCSFRTGSIPHMHFATGAYVNFFSISCYRNIFHIFKRNISAFHSNTGCLQRTTIDNIPNCRIRCRRKRVGTTCFKGIQRRAVKRSCRNIQIADVHICFGPE